MNRRSVDVDRAGAAAQQPRQETPGDGADLVVDRFDHAPVALIELDCSAYKDSLDELVAGGVEDLRAHFEEQPDAWQSRRALIQVAISTSPPWR